LQQEISMAKGQMRSNKEVKKPKKAAAEKPKAGSPAGYVPSSKGGGKSGKGS
jgi:hypothetical protein